MSLDVSTKFTIFSNLSKTEVKVFSIVFIYFFYSKCFFKEDIRFCTSISSLDCTTMVTTTAYVGGVEVFTITVAIETFVVTTLVLADTSPNLFSANVSSFFFSLSA